MDDTRPARSHTGAIIAATWIVLLLLECLLLTFSPGTIFDDPPFGIRANLTLAGFELLALLLPAIVLGFILAAGRPAGTDQQPSRGARARRTVSISLVFVPFLAYFSSWAAFLSVGSFLDADGFLFVIANLHQIFQHAAQMAPAAAVIGSIVLLTLSIAVPALIPALARIAPPVLRVSALASILGVVAVVVLGPTIDPDDPRPVSDSEVGMVYSVGDLWVSMRDDRSGPMMHALADLRSLGIGEDEQPLASDTSDANIIRRPIISLNEYLASADLESMSRPNVIIVLVESLRNDQLLAGGSLRTVMPTVERLALRGRSFTHVYTQASHSNYADTAPLSSHYPLRSRRPYVYPETPTYPRVMIYDILKGLGYHTAVISSQNERWGGLINYLRTGSIDHFFHSESYDGPDYIPRDDIGFEAFVKGSKRSGKIDDRITINEAIRWIDSLDETPFFIYINLQDSHVPYETPTDFTRRFGPEKVPFRVRFNDFPPQYAEIVKNMYADSLAYVDEQLGRLVDHLETTGRLEDTVIVVTGDTGQAFYEHGYAAHANILTNEVMRVPVVIDGPGIDPAPPDDRPAQHIDIPPTILDVLGLPSHPSFQGISLLDPAPPLDRSIFLVVQSPLARQYAIVRSGYKLIHDEKTGRDILLDLNEDPGETRNIAGRMPELARDLRRRLDLWRAIQIEYYGNLREHQETYPPVISDS